MTRHPNRYSLLAKIFVLCLGLLLTAPAYAQQPSRTSQDNLKNSPKVLAAFRDVVAKSSQCTVRVLCDDKDAVLGTVVGADGWIITKASELKGKVVCKLKDGQTHEAKIVGVHNQHDLALLKIDAKGLKVVEWIESKTAAPGNWVASAGLGEDPVAIGVVSVATRNVAVRGVPPPSNRGGGYLGVSLAPDGPGAKIAMVSPKTPAEKAGLKADDVILAIDKEEIANTEALMNYLQQRKPGDNVTIKFKRGEEELELKATLDKRPLNRGDFQNRMGGEPSERRTGFPTFFQHDTVLKPSDCGGPIVDLDGKALGINIARAGRVESYTIPSEVVISLLDELKSGKLAPKPEEKKEEPKPEEKKPEPK